MTKDGANLVFFTDDKGTNLKVDIDGHAEGPIFQAGTGDAPLQLPRELHDVLPLPDGASLTGHYAAEAERGERLAIVSIADPSKARLLSTAAITRLCRRMDAL